MAPSILFNILSAKIEAFSKSTLLLDKILKSMGAPEGGPPSGAETVTIFSKPLSLTSDRKLSKISVPTAFSESFKLIKRFPNLSPLFEPLLLKSEVFPIVEITEP